MNKHLRRMIFLLLFPGSVRGDVIPLMKLYHHQGANNGNHAIELGNLSLYFKQMPRVESSMVARGDEVHHHFFLPHVESSSELQRYMEQINKQKSLSYAIQINSQETPRKGLEIVLKYPKDKIGVKYSRFASIKLQKGLVFRLYNKELLRRVTTEKGIITTTLLNRPQVFIDCGHGGADSGAVAFATEKEVSLQVGLEVAQLLRSHNIDVNLSRNRDVSLNLDERTSMANQRQADLFVSLHANAAMLPHCSGVETYLLSPQLLCTLGSDLSQEEQACDHIFQQDKYKKSSRLAHCVHQHIITMVHAEPTAKDRRIKPTVSQVLIGTQMPSILVELGFVTHPQEAQLLSQQSYQKRLAQGIVSGILQYVQQV